MPSLPDRSRTNPNANADTDAHQLRHNDEKSRPAMHAPRALSPNSAQRIRVKNRRKRYLDMHPEYFDSPSLELADPLAYDRLIRRFQTPAEREADGKKKGYAGVLEADLYRSEAKVAALADPDYVARMRWRWDKEGEIVAEERDEVPISLEEGLVRWRREMELRFLMGGDGEFDYGDVDESEEFDDRGVLEREAEERWFEEEEPMWVGKGERSARLEEDDDDGIVGKDLTGQTGVQDF